MHHGIREVRLGKKGKELVMSLPRRHGGALGAVTAFQSFVPTH